MLIGRAYRQSGLLTDAADEFKKAIALDPHFPRAHYYLGMTYLLDEGQSKIGEALEQFKIEVAANPDEFFGNYYLGVVSTFNASGISQYLSCRRPRRYSQTTLILISNWARLIRK